MFNFFFFVLIQNLTLQDEKFNELPKWICRTCITFLEQFKDFQIQCEISDRKFRQFIAERKIDVDDELLIKTETYEENEIQENFEINFNEDEQTFEEPELIKSPTVKRKRDAIKSNKVWECSTCSKTFDVYQEYVDDIKSHGNDRFKCDECDKYFKRIYDRDRHKLSHGESKFECKICSKKYQTKTNLKKHIDSLHNKVLNHFCDICGKGFYESTFLKIHRSSVHVDSRDYNCLICEKTFKTDLAVKVHVQNVHVDPTSKKVVLKKDSLVTCDICGKNLASKIVLENHMKIHSDECSYECKICGRKFKQSSCLSNHQKMHSDVRRFVCTVDNCGNTFRQKAHLEAHMTTHSGEKKFVCKICGKAMAYKCNLNTHMRTHLGITPYSCEFCQEKFHDHSSLKRHKKRHVESDL